LRGEAKKFNQVVQEKTRMANYTAGEEKLYDSVVEAIQQIKLPDRETLKR
jgi:hypothetical protein